EGRWRVDGDSRAGGGPAVAAPYNVCVSATTPPRVIRAARGTALRCRGWVQEAALRMLENNLDPEVAERPEDLVVYGGAGKAARRRPSLPAVRAAPRRPGPAQTPPARPGEAAVI